MAALHQGQNNHDRIHLRSILCVFGNRSALQGPLDFTAIFKQKTHHPFHLADDFKRFISHLSHHVLLSKLKGEGRKWLIALIKRDISHFRSCIKEVIIPSPLSPQFPHFPAFHSVSLSPFPLPLKNYNMIILKPRGPAGGRYLVGGPSELGPLCVSRPSGAQAV